MKRSAQLDTQVDEVFDPAGIEQDDWEDDDPDPQDIQEYHYNSGENTFHFNELAAIIAQHLNTPEIQTNDVPITDKASSRKEHNRRQLQIWQILRTKVAADDSIPTALFDPPRTYLQVRFAEWPREGHFCCPCDLYEDALQFVEIRAEKGSKHGITKNIFIEQVAEALCGTSNGSGWVIGNRSSRPVIDHFDWKNNGGIMGHLFAMTRGFVE